jgi:hypothetical protein
MKLAIKDGLLACGIISSFCFMSALSNADETIPIEFNKGDSISADVTNALLSRINNVQKGFTTSQLNHLKKH